MAKRYLLLDCDGVIFNSNVLIDKEVQRIEFRASDKYCEMLNQMSDDCHNQLHDLEIERANNPERASTLRATIEDVKRLRREHFLLKDMVLEEVLPKYRGIINYDKIFQLHHTFPGVIEKIKEIAETGAFDGIFIVSHYNSAREAEAKLRFFKKYLPMVRVILVKFHQDEFVLGNDQLNQARRRTNKVNDFRIQTGIDDYSLTSFIDDSISIIDEAIELGVRHCFHKKKKDKTLALLDIAFANAMLDANIERDEEERRKK